MSVYQQQQQKKQQKIEIIVNMMGFSYIMVTLSFLVHIFV